jgi:hypothetical protein
VKSVLGFLLVLLVAAGSAASSACSSGGAEANYEVFVETQPSPMQSGRLATVNLRIRDGGGQPLSGAKVTFKAQHTGMAHGSGGTVTAEEREPGVYSGGLIPPMSGKYAMTVVVEGPRGKSEKTLDAEVL